MIGPGEPAWLPEDTDAALEWLEHQESLCGGCGRPRHESFDPDSEDSYDAHVLVCHACRAREQRAAEMRSGDNADTSGIYIAITRDD